tara:strand:+ start:461 stop:850 length:390 start_codon:yes stop_codon:yes gene_type:complete
MCWGGKPGTIYQPDYNAYNLQFNLQKEAIQSQIDNETRLVQNQLNTARLNKQSALTKVNEQARIRAENVDRQARMLAEMAGPPPPEESAKNFIVGAKERGLEGTKGKQSLRIGRKVASKSLAGAGLNIT